LSACYGQVPHVIGEQDKLRADGTWIARARLLFAGPSLCVSGTMPIKGSMGVWLKRLQVQQLNAMGKCDCATKEGYVMTIGCISLICESHHSAQSVCRMIEACRKKDVNIQIPWF
jgi:hypothetical protein